MPDEVVEVVWSSSREHRASIVRRADGLLQVVVERFMRADPEFEEPAGWEPVHGRVILTDTVERAREVAADELASCAAPER